MALLFAEKGIDVLLSDPSEKAIQKVIDNGKKDGVPAERLHSYTGTRS